MSHTKKNIRRAVVLVLLAAIVLMVGTASAGWFDKKQDKSQGLLKNHRFHRFPPTSFIRGDLHQEARGEWYLGERRLQLTKGGEVFGEGGQKTDLATGRTVIVSGTIVGDMIMATSVRMLSRDLQKPSTMTTQGQKTPSDVNPQVGVLKDSPM